LDQPSLGKALIIFLDGVGVGADDPRFNPLARSPLTFWRSLLGGRVPASDNGGFSGDQAALMPLDACLGVPGLPQSATGQTTILTGVNAPGLLGEHSGPYPSAALVELLKDSLFEKIIAGGGSVAFANAYPERFMSRLRRGKERLSANTRAALLAGLPLRGWNDLKYGEAVSALLTNEHWQEWGYPPLPLTPFGAGQNLGRLSQAYTLTFFEFWFTDVLGHRQEMDEAVAMLEKLDGFLEGIYSSVDLAVTSVILISDHGNMEDLSTTRHTLNPALGFFGGRGYAALASRVHSLADFAPALLTLLQNGASLEKHS
jgi:2,3-bisphosphoglycerate-independent phosphoglycerate mutase